MSKLPTSIPESTEHLKVGMVARRYSVSTRTVDRWLASEKVNFPRPVMVVNERRYWSLADLETWERARARTAKAA
jgi:predicted DNA-binding transcriptional regulator AlpA